MTKFKGQISEDLNWLIDWCLTSTLAHNEIVPTLLVKNLVQDKNIFQVLRPRYSWNTAKVDVKHQSISQFKSSDIN
jgi:hypothetical protein